MAIQKYDISGFYLYNGSQEFLEGIIEIDTETNHVQGDITDLGSRSKNQKLKGIVEITDKDAHLYFTKYPKDSGLANLIYRLSKNTPEIEGNYRGRWSASPEKIETITFGREAIAILRRDESVRGIGDYAELSLHPL